MFCLDEVLHLNQLLWYCVICLLIDKLVVWLSSENTSMWICAGRLEIKALAVITLVEKIVKAAEYICGHSYFSFEGSVSMGPEADCIF